MRTADGTTTAAPASQTLSRGLRTLEILAETPEGRTTAEIAEVLGVHRSIAYRILRTLEEHSLVVRDAGGRFQPGPGLASLARGVAPRLQTAALPELTAVAAELQMTSFIAVWDRRHCVTLVAVEPPHGEGTLVQRPGSRHPFDAGAPGIAIQSALTEARWERLAPGEPYREESRNAAAAGYAVSCDEVIPGVSSVAAPILLRGQLPAALAVVYLRSDRRVEEIGARVAEAARAVGSVL
ncbi:IclR family transcriptional regulator [Arthrobacter agilis]|uniref:IclR family transcriptional regulator n=1 Tax=Arthrobacter agilis TaxID=37921 RepID=UPI00278B17B2|nr:helix-turn-helix domain-containing protein [Arthrobacter agilis]MDQ0736374.1 DNA-binding IclR family transcriptional regulator [Arthrobacter agilis]